MKSITRMSLGWTAGALYLWGMTLYYFQQGKLPFVTTLNAGPFSITETSALARELEKDPVHPQRPVTPPSPVNTPPPINTPINPPPPTSGCGVTLQC